MVQQICNSVECNGSLSASCGSLDHHNPVFRIPDNGVLLFLYGPYNIFQLYVSISAKLRFQDLIIDLHITLKFIDHPAASDLVLPFGSDLPFHEAKRGLIGSRTFVKIIKQAAYRSPPVIDQRHMPCFLRKISDPYIKLFRFFFSLITKIHSSEKRRIQHLLQPVEIHLLLLVCIDLMEQGLLIVKILIAVLVHLRIVFPVILMHPLNIFLSLENGFSHFSDPLLQLSGYFI